MATPHKLVALQFDGGGLMLIVNDTDAGQSFSYTTPNIPGASLVSVSTARNDAGYSAVYSVGLPVDATEVTETSPAAAELSAPVDGATGVTIGTTFSWGMAPGVKVVVISLAFPWDYDSSPSSRLMTPGTPDTNSYVFLTSGTSVTIPDLTSAGLGAPVPSTAYTWSVYGLGPYADVEAASAGVRGAGLFWYFNTVAGGWANSTTGGFVTARPLPVPLPRLRRHAGRQAQRVLRAGRQSAFPDRKTVGEVSYEASAPVAVASRRCSPLVLLRYQL